MRIRHIPEFVEYLNGGGRSKSAINSFSRQLCEHPNFREDVLKLAASAGFRHVAELQLIDLVHMDTIRERIRKRIPEILEEYQKKELKIKPADYLRQKLKNHIWSGFKKINTNPQEQARSHRTILKEYIETEKIKAKGKVGRPRKEPATIKAKGKIGRPRKEEGQAKDGAMQVSEEKAGAEQRAEKQAGEEAKKKLIERVMPTLNEQERKLLGNIGEGERTILVALGIQNRRPEVQKLILKRTHESLRRKLEDAFFKEVE